MYSAMASHDTTGSTTTTTCTSSTSRASCKSNAAAAPVVKACNYCRNSHTACDGERPCRRCVKRGVGDQCCDLVPRKKGRPARNDPRFRPKHPNDGNNQSSKNGSNSSSGGSSNEDKAERRSGLTDSANYGFNTNNSPPSASSIGGSGASASMSSNARQAGTTAAMLGTSDRDTAAPLSSQSPLASQSGQQANHIRVHMYDQHIDDLPFTDDGYSDDDESSSDEQRYQHQHCQQHRHSNQRVDEDRRKRTRSDESELASKVIAMMADEMQKLRKENAKLRLKVKKLRKHKRAREEEEEMTSSNQQLRHQDYHSSMSYPGSTHKRPRYDVPSTSPPQVPSGDSASVAEARKHIPFLKHYDSLPNIVVTDITRPVIAFGIPTLGEPAILAYASEPFADMLQFTMDELHDLPLGAIISENPKMRDRLMPSFLCSKEPWSVSEPIVCCPLMRRKDGRTLRSTSNAQFFYGPTGLIRYCALVTLHWEEDTIREDEHFGNMLDRALLPPPRHGAQQHSYPTTTQPMSSSLPHNSAAPSVTSRTFYNEEDIAGQASTTNYWERIISLAAPQHPTAPLHSAYGV